MRRPIQHGLALGTLSALLALALLTESPETPAAPLPMLHKSYTESIPGIFVKFDMMAIPRGRFLMGSPADEKGRGADEGPQHSVIVAAYWMGKCEVTWDEYDCFRDEMGMEERNEQIKLLRQNPDAITGPSPPYADETAGHGRGHNPVLGISHHAAMTYCRWLSKKTGNAYRLPTEAEWEHAARAGTTTAYCFGDDPKQLDEYAWHAGNCTKPGEDDRHPQKVGKKKPNPWGLCDMYGNVAEYCLDHYDKDHYATFALDKPTLQPVLMPSEKLYSYVVRGGSWADRPEQCRSAARRGSDRSWNRQDPQKPQSIWWLTDGDFVGFRVVRAVVEQDNLKDIRSKVTWGSR